MEKEKKDLLFEAIKWYIKFHKEIDEFYRYDLVEIVYEITENIGLELSEEETEDLAYEFEESF